VRPAHGGRAAGRNRPADVAAPTEPVGRTYQEHRRHLTHLTHRKHLTHREHWEHLTHREHREHRGYPVDAASQHPTNSPELARPAGAPRRHPAHPADPMAVAAQRPEPALRSPCPAAGSRRTCRRGRRRRARWARRSARSGRSGLGRMDSGRRRAGRRGSPGWPPTDRCRCYRPACPAVPAQRADTSLRQARSPPAVRPAAGRVPSARRPPRPARRPRAVAGPDRRWPRWSPNPSIRKSHVCPAEDLAREPVTARAGACDRRGRLATVPTPDVIPYQGWTHGWTCSELDLSTQNGHRLPSGMPGRPLGGGPGGCCA
jgi:hypothetical protein